MRKRLVLHIIFIALIIFVFGCNHQNSKNSAKYKRSFGKKIPVEYVQKSPISKQYADSVRVGDLMENTLNFLGIPSQDSGKNKYIWHYMVEGGTYLQVIGSDTVEKVIQYTNDDIK